jgi:hypothetical protein
MRQACVCRWPVASLSPALSRFALGSKTIAGMVVKYRHPAARDDLSPRLRLVRPGVRDLPSARRPRAGAGQAVRRLRKVAIATEAGREITMAPRTPHNLVAALASYRSTRARGTAATSSVARQLDGRRPDHRRGRAPRATGFRSVTLPSASGGRSSPRTRCGLRSASGWQRRPGGRIGPPRSWFASATIVTPIRNN